MPIPPYDGTVLDNGDIIDNYGGDRSRYGHGTYNSPSCGNTTWGYMYHLPPTWYSQPTRKFPVVYVPSFGGGTNENWLFVRSNVSDPLDDSPVYTQNMDGQPWYRNWGKDANCVLICLNGGVDVPYPFDANPAADMYGVLMLESQTSEILDFIESPSHSVFGGRLIPQGKDDPNGGKFRGIMGHSGGTHHSAYHAALHPERYSSVYLMAVSGGGDWDPTFTSGFAAWQIHMCASDQSFGNSIWAIHRPDGAFGAAFNANYNNIKNSGIWWHMQVSHPENINETVSDAFWNNLNNNGFNVDAEVKIPFTWHTDWAYTVGGNLQPLYWHVSKFQLQPSLNPGSYTATQSTPLNIAGSTLVANDTDPQNLTLSVASVQNAVNGSVVLSGSTVTFTPTSGYTGVAAFDYTAQNTDGQTASATVSVDVQAGTGTQTTLTTAASDTPALDVLVDEHGNALTADAAPSGPVDVVDSAPTIGVATLTVLSSSVVLADYVLDHGLSSLHLLVDKIHVCSINPPDYAGVLSSSLGNKSFGVGAVFGIVGAAAPSGRQVVSAPVTNGTITLSGTVAYWAAVDSVNSRLLASGDVSAPRNVVSGELFILASVTLQLPRI